MFGGPHSTHYSRSEMRTENINKYYILEILSAQADATCVGTATSDIEKSSKMETKN